MFTINFKGKPNPKNKQWVKIDMILFRTGYTRVSKILSITGLYKDWDQKNQCFIAGNVDNIDRNKLLLETRKKYMALADEWDRQGLEWSPVQWSHYFDTVKKEKEKVKILSISQCTDIIIQEMRGRKRIKNGKILTSNGTADNYKYCKNTLNLFTRQVYKKSFSSYFFNDINEKFLLDFVIFLQERGIKNGNKGNITDRLRQFYGIFCYSNKMGMPGTDVSIFECVKHHVIKKKEVPQTIPFNVITQIEEMDRSCFKPLEILYIDMFLFSFYSGGMARVDLANLTWDQIDKGILNYERIKFSKFAKMPFTDKAKAIIEKYKDNCYSNYVLPVFTHKHTTEKKQTDKLRRFCERQNKTLKKVARYLKLDIEFTAYAARGTFITKMLDEGFHPVEVAEFAGNSPRTIYDHYWKQTNTSQVLETMNRVI